MNRIVAKWNKHQERTKEHVPDAIQIDEDTKFYFSEEPEMDYDTSLTKVQFRSLIKLMKTADLGIAETVRSNSFKALKRLKVKRDLSKAVKGIPKGHTEVNVGNIVAWLEKVDPADPKAVAQVVAVDATAVTRMSS